MVVCLWHYLLSPTCVLFSVTDKSVKSLSSVSASNLETLFCDYKFHESECARVSVYDMFRIIFCGYESKCYCFIRSFHVRNYSEEQSKLTYSHVDDYCRG